METKWTDLLPANFGVDLDPGCKLDWVEWLVREGALFEGIRRAAVKCDMGKDGWVLSLMQPLGSPRYRWP